MLENIVWAPRHSLSMLEKWLRTVSLSDEFRPISDGFRLWIKTGSSQTALILLWVAGHTMYSTGMKYRTHWNHQIRALTRNRQKTDIIPPLVRVLRSPHSFFSHSLHVGCSRDRIFVPTTIEIIKLPSLEFLATSHPSSKSWIHYVFVC